MTTVFPWYSLIHWLLMSIPHLTGEHFILAVFDDLLHFIPTLFYYVANWLLISIATYNTIRYDFAFSNSLSVVTRDCCLFIPFIRTTVYHSPFTVTIPVRCSSEAFCELLHVPVPLLRFYLLMKGVTFWKLLLAILVGHLPIPCGVLHRHHNNSGYSARYTTVLDYGWR